MMFAKRWTNRIAAPRSQNRKYFSSLFKFGIIADIQYVDLVDSPNFQGTRIRRYRQSLSIYQEAARYWKQNNVDFSILLGDLIDGRAAMDKSQMQCLQNILDIAEQGTPVSYYCFGNHCHYCFSRPTLHNTLVTPNILKGRNYSSHDFPANDEVKNQLHYHFSPYPGFRFISLDGYDVSLIGPSRDAYKENASALLREHNHNDLSLGHTWFQGLPRDKLRWVPFNGGIGEEQLQWLQRTLTLAKQHQEKVILFCHQPVYAPTRPNSLVWNAEEVLQLLWSFDNVVMWMAGHDHGGQSYLDEKGIVHLVPPAPIECELGEKTFGYFDVFQDHLRLHWVGKSPVSKSFQPWPEMIPFR